MIPPFGKGGGGGFLDTSILHKISPYPSLPKRGIFGSMTGVTLLMHFFVRVNIFFRKATLPRKKAIFPLQ
jgi:hypothetical protein